MNTLQLRDYQREAVRAVLDGYNDGARSQIIVMATGCGKAQPEYSSVLTSSGFKRISKVKVGDKVIGSEGQETKVVGIYPQGIQQVYRVQFHDGAFVDCCLDHLWEVYDEEQKETRVVATKDLMGNLLYNNSAAFRFHVKNNLPIQGETMFDREDIETHGKDFAFNFKHDKPCSIRKDILYGSTVEFREMLFNDIVNNLQVMPSLTGTVMIVSKSEAGCVELQELARTLGYLATMTFIGDNYYLTVNKESRTRYIKSIEFVSDEACLCIKVEAENGLYITDNYIVTHNTVIFSEIIKRVNEVTQKKALVLAHREELLQQAKEKIESIAPHLHVEVEQGSNVADYENADVIVASVATIGREGSSRILNLNPEDFSIIVVDECHHTISDTYVNVLKHFGAYKQDGFQEGSPFVLGVTATPERRDNIGMEKIFERVAYKFDLIDGVSQGFLSTIHAYTIKTDVDISSVRVSLGDYQLSELSNAVNTPWRNALVVNSYLDLADGLKAIAFCVNVQHAIDLTKNFNDFGVTAECITGSTPKPERERIIDEYKNGELKVLVSVNVAVEGFDAPNTKCILMARPTTSKTIYMQAVGRGTRIADGKERLILLDFVDTTAKNDLITSSHLIGMSEPLHKLYGHDIIELKPKIDELLGNNPYFDINSIKLEDIQKYIDESSILSLMELPPEIQSMTNFAWLRYADGYKIGFGTEPFGQEQKDAKRYAEILPDAIGNYHVHVYFLVESSFAFKNGYKKFTRVSIFQDTRQSLEGALMSCDTFLRKRNSHIEKLIGKDAPWMSQPASPAQINMVRKLGIVNLDFSKINKGQASRIIGHLFNNTTRTEQKRAEQRSKTKISKTNNYTPKSYTTFKDDKKQGNTHKSRRKNVKRNNKHR